MRIILIITIMFSYIFKVSGQTDSIESVLQISLRQIDNKTQLKQFGINGSLKAAYSLYFGVSIDYFLSTNLNIELHSAVSNYIHYNPTAYDYSVRLNYWFKNKYKHNGFFPFLGLTYGKMGITLGDETDHYPYFGIPIGVYYCSKNGFQTSFLINALYHYKHRGYDVFFPIPELKIGWRFKTR